MVCVVVGGFSLIKIMRRFNGVPQDEPLFQGVEDELLNTSAIITTSGLATRAIKQNMSHAIYTAPIAYGASVLFVFNGYYQRNQMAINQPPNEPQTLPSPRRRNNTSRF